MTCCEAIVTKFDVLVLQTDCGKNEKKREASSQYNRVPDRDLNLHLQNQNVCG